MSQILVRGGTAVAMNRPGSSRAAVLVEGGLIKELGSEIVADSSAEVIDASESMVIPGFVDTLAG
jgi:predicted amidohydrolase YtcJ